jgi:hypothetical protein
VHEVLQQRFMSLQYELLTPFDGDLFVQVKNVQLISSGLMRRLSSHRSPPWSTFTAIS